MLHHGRTGPRCDALIAAGITRVVGIAGQTGTRSYPDKALPV